MITNLVKNILLFIIGLGIVVIAQDTVYRPGQILTVNSGVPPAGCTVGGVYIRTDIPASISVCSELNQWTDLAIGYSLGSYNPVLSASAGTIPTFTTNFGNYTRIGDTVFFNVRFDNTTGGTAGNGANQLSVSLPFTTGATQLSVRIPIGTSLNGAGADIIFGTISPSSSTMLLWKQTTGPNVGIFNENDLGNANIRQLTVSARFRL